MTARSGALSSAILGGPARTRAEGTPFEPRPPATRLRYSVTTLGKTLFEGGALAAARRIVRAALAGVHIGARVVLGLTAPDTGETVTMANKFASEELLAAPLPELIKNLGLAVATANKELRSADPDMRFTVNTAEIELRVAISVETSSSGKIEGGGKISVFSVNASYAKTYGFKEEASSVIKLTLAAVPTAPPAA
ncbi:MAG: trypco2 family protein [Vicinamibacterales bacterium]